MKTFIYSEKIAKARKGNPHPIKVKITVHRVVSNMPRFVDKVECDPASWRGAYGEALEIIATELNRSGIDGVRLAIYDGECQVKEV